jgi:hypothetical protein
VKAWLHGIKLEENTEVGPANIGAGDNWRRFPLLVQAIWDHGEIPPQLLWVIIVLIPKWGMIIEGSGLWSQCERYASV